MRTACREVVALTRLVLIAAILCFAILPGLVIRAFASNGVPILATVGQPFSFQTPVVGGATGYFASGLPPGLNMDSATGLISGTPTSAGTYEATLIVNLPSGNGVLLKTFIVDNPAAPVITSPTTGAAFAGHWFSYQITALNSPTNYTFGATGLPAGLKVVPKTGLISGIPEGAGISTITLTATNTSGNSSQTLTLTVTQPALPVQWVARPSGVGDERVTGMALDAAGNLYVAGYFQGVASFGTNSLNSAGSDDAFIAKLDSTGAFIWARSFGSANGDYINSLVVDVAGNAYVTGDFVGIVSIGATTLTNQSGYAPFVAKLDAAGNFVWATKPEGSGYGRSISVDGAGNVYVAGYFSGSATFGSTTLTGPFFPPDQSFVTKLDSNGNFLWARTSGGNSIHVPIAVAADGAGSAWVAGSFRGQATLGTNILNGSVVPPLTFIAKLDTDGNYLWARQGTSPSGGQTAYALAVDGMGRVTVTGTFNGDAAFGNFSLTNLAGSPIFVTQLDTDGVFRWARSGGVEGGFSDPYALTMDNTGSSYVAGRYYSGSAVFGTSVLASQGGADGFVAKLDADGHFQWALTVGGSGDDSATSVAANGNGDVYLTGYFRGLTAFGASNLSSTGSDDAFIAKLGTPPGLASRPADQSGVAGSNVLLSASPDGNMPVFYQWLRNGEPIMDATNATLNLSIPNRSAGGIFSVFVTNQYGAALGSSIAVRVFVPPRFDRTPMVLGDGRVRLVFGDALGSALTANELTNFVVEATTNVFATNWVRYTNGFSLVGALIQFEDSDAPSLPKRFYRVIER